ncbi:hypothetical protein TNCV_2421931 [Trichonephila clavipes]|nr:hypothetical protein TNCV_2421931 [Trichonephila clavipes]
MDDLSGSSFFPTVTGRVDSVERVPTEHHQTKQALKGYLPAAKSYHMDAVLHHENPPTSFGVEPTTKGIQVQPPTNCASQPID